jgi:hypothetical protein
MFTSIVKIVAATALFAGVHSLLASRTAKAAAVVLFGERRRNGLYRPFYNILAITTFGALILYGIRLPDRELYRVRGTLARLMQIVQAAFVVYLLYGMRQIGFLKFYGVSNLIAFLKSKPFILPEPEAQGPMQDINGEMKVTGPFRTSRHPLSFGMLPVFWLMPRMTVNLAAFNLVTTLYLFIGAFHEETRLKAVYGQAYLDYQKSETNFFFSPISGAYSKPSVRRITDVFGWN